MKHIGLTIGLSCWIGCTTPPNNSREQPSAPRSRADVVSRVDVRVGYFDKALEESHPRHRNLPEPALQYGQPGWSDAARAELDALTPGKRWPLGRDFWTTLDVNSGLRIGDAELGPGKYYLALERSDDGFDLIVLDSKDVRSAGLDISRVAETSGGRRAALKHDTADEPAEKLALEFRFPVADTPPGLVDLHIRFGPHAWSVDLLADVESSGKDVEALGLEAPRRMARFIHDRGVVTVGYGQPEWKPEYVEQFDAVTQGKRWRLGRNWWTTLDTNVALTLGETTIEPGDYYLVGERPEDSDDWYLRVLDPATVRALQLDPVMAFETTGGQSVQLTHELTESVKELMAIEIYPDENDADTAMLAAWWGNHRLSVPMRLGGR